MYMVKEGTALHIALLWCLVAFFFNLYKHVYTVMLNRYVNLSVQGN
jgi:hypothetical protein